MSRGGHDWVLASTNSGKLADFRRLLAGTPIDLRSLDATSADAPEETAVTFVENALIKARHASRVSGRPALADDSGLCVAALGDAPGVHSARYAGPGASDHENVERLLQALSGVVGDQRVAVFHCVIVAVGAPDDPAPVVASGRWPGRIAERPAGKHGFGYDPVFFDPGLGRTAAELSPAQKNAVSHRGRACAELRRLLGF